MAEKDSGTAKNTDDIAKIICAINPSFASNSDELEKELKTDFWKAVELAKPKDKVNIKDPEVHKLIYDSAADGLEPVYFFILDKMNALVGKTEKLVDNFSSSVGSGHFSEMGGKSTKMQEEAMKMMQTIGLLIKSLVNLVYDLREFEMRLSQYNAARSKDKIVAEAGMLALKQVWMDNVDHKKGRGSLNMLSQELQFVTIRDAFMIASSIEEVKKLDLNERVIRILEPRILEFLKWRDLSEKEMIKRYEIERSYLRSQVNSLKMYTRWAKPYLKAANQLEMKDSKDPSLVNAFNIMVLQLSLLAKTGKYDFKDAAENHDLPAVFASLKMKRGYYSVVLVDIYFRGIPQKLGQHYTFGGKVEAVFRAYSLNDDELKMLSEKLEQSDMNEALKLAEGMTSESLEQIREDIEYFLKDEKEKSIALEKKQGDVNPFTALFNFSGKKKEEKKKIESIKKDSYAERLVREKAQHSANNKCFDIFDIYKKGHDMASHPSPFDEIVVSG